MARRPNMDPALMAAMLGLQDSGSVAASVAMTIAMQRARGMVGPEEARATAARFKLPDDMLPLVPKEPGLFASRKHKEAFRTAIFGLKRLDGLPPGEREDAIAQVKGLLGVG